jgi:hypothetical protein
MHKRGWWHITDTCLVKAISHAKDSLGMETTILQDKGKQRECSASTASIPRPTADDDGAQTASSIKDTPNASVPPSEPSKQPRLPIVIPRSKAGRTMIDEFAEISRADAAAAEAEAERETKITLAKIQARREKQLQDGQLKELKLEYKLLKLKKSLGMGTELASVSVATLPSSESASTPNSPSDSRLSLTPLSSHSTGLSPALTTPSSMSLSFGHTSDDLSFISQSTDGLEPYGRLLDFTSSPGAGPSHAHGFFNTSSDSNHDWPPYNPAEYGSEQKF